MGWITCSSRSLRLRSRRSSRLLCSPPDAEVVDSCMCLKSTCTTPPGQQIGQELVYKNNKALKHFTSCWRTQCEQLTPTGSGRPSLFTGWGVQVLTYIVDNISHLIKLMSTDDPPVSRLCRDVHRPQRMTLDIIPFSCGKTMEEAASCHLRVSRYSDAKKKQEERGSGGNVTTI